MKKYILSFLLAFLAFAANVAYGKTIPVVIPFSPGGVTDTIWRTLEPELNKELAKQNYTVVTEYAAGAGGSIGATRVATADSTTLLFTSSSLIINLATNPVAKYHPEDFHVFGHFGSLPMIVVVPADGPGSAAELAALCKKKNLSYASPGVGSTIHMTTVVLLKSLKCNAVHVPYKSTTVALPDLHANRLDFFVDFSVGATANMARDDKLKSIITLGTHRRFGGRTAQEQGLALPEIKNWHILAANTTANPGDVEIINTALNNVLKNPQLIQKIQDLGLEGVGSTIDNKFLRSQLTFYQKFVKDYKILE